MSATRPEVLLLCMSSGIGGTEQSMRTLARGLAGAGVVCEAWLPEPLQRPDAPAWFAESGVPTRTGSAFMAGWTRLASAIRFFRPHRGATVNVHLPWLTPSLSMIVAMRLAGIRRIIVSPHGGDVAGVRRGTALAYNLASRTIVTTPYQRALLTGFGVDARRIAEIPLGIPPLSGDQSPLAPRDESGRLVVGTLCRFVPLKRVDALLRACAAIPDFRKRFRLVIGGDGPEDVRLRALAAESPNVGAEFLGLVTEPARFYASLDLFVMVSELESFGLVYMEAARQGVPSIGCRNGGVPYAVLEGETGWLVDPESPQDELVALFDEIESRRALVAERGAAARRVAAHYTEAEYVSAYARLFGELRRV